MISLNDMSRPAAASGGSSGAKMRLRPFPTQMDEKYAKQLWDGLKNAIQEIQKKNNSGLSFEELYRHAYTLVLHKNGEKLYTGVRHVVTEHLRESVRPVVVDAMNTADFMQTLNDAWSDHTTAMVMIRDILMYMDRVYVAQNNCLDVYRLGLSIFRQEVIGSNNVSVVSDHLRSTVLSLIAQERTGNPVNWMGIKNACSMLVQLGIDNHSVYENEFETPFLNETATFYQETATKFLAEKNASSYVIKVEQCIEAESDRARKYLDPSTEAKVLKVLEDTLITKHMQSVVDMKNGVIYMLTNDKVEDLRRMYILLKRVPKGLQTMTAAMSMHLRSIGMEIVSDEGEHVKNPVSYIQALLDLKDSFDHFLSDAFSSDKIFKNAIQSDFETFFNTNVRSPEFLSLYMDDKLKKGVKALNDSEWEQVLDKTMVLFRFLQEKDCFEKYYKQHLCKRLLLDKSISDDAEQAMLGKLKTECGCQFTQRLESMFRDKELWSTVAVQYKEYRDSWDSVTAKLKDPVEISVRVLTAGIWPTQNSPLCNLPPTCATSFQTFEEYYLNKHNGRKITLNTMLGTAEVKAVFYGTPSEDGSQQEEPCTSSAQVNRREEHKILLVNTHQMIILLRFNIKSRTTFDELLQTTQIPEKELKRNLQSLAMGKPTQRVLCRRGRGKDIDGQDEFFVNDSFTSKLTRIKIQLVTSKGETEPERKETRNKVDEDRKHEVEAAIVRIMKSRKRLAHNNLITDVTQQLKHRFLPSPQLIKKRIESLIEREYLTRDEADHKTYNYVA